MCYSPVLKAYFQMNVYTHMHMEYAQRSLSPSCGGGASRLSSVECYDPERNEWRAVAPMAEVRAWFGCAVLDGKIYVAGGYCDGGSARSSVECYDPERDEWQPVAPLLEGRYEHVMVALGGKLYVAGRNPNCN